MSILVIAEHDNKTLKAATLNTIGAAKKLGGEIHVLVAGSGCQAVAEQAAKAEGVTKVLKADTRAAQKLDFNKILRVARGEDSDAPQADEPKFAE